MQFFASFFYFRPIQMRKRDHFNHSFMHHKTGGCLQINCSLRAIILSVLFFTIAQISWAGTKTYDFNAICQQAYSDILCLKINSGKKLIAQARQQNPDNLIPDLLDSYTDFFILFFNEDPSEYERRSKNFDIYITNLESGPHTSPYYRYSRSVVYIQKACAAIKFGEKWKAGWDFRRAFSLVKENKKSFPAFVPNNMIYGPMQVIAGTIPDSYKWLAGLFGISGSIKEGMALMQTVLNSNHAEAKLFHTEAIFYYCYISFYIQNKQEEVFQFINQQKPDLVNNHLMTYMAANLGLNAKRNEYARSVILKRNISSEYMPTPVWDYELGYIHLRHLEYKEAANRFSSFTKNFKGRFYVKDAYEKLSWALYLQGNNADAEIVRKLVVSKGNTETDADKESYKEAKSGVWPHPVLLKARLLNDGGYLNEALSLLQSTKTADFKTSKDQLEYTYRLGRIYDDLRQFDAALIQYERAIETGASLPEYYASRAALQAGIIYEKKGDKSLAVIYYKKCFTMKNHSYKASIDQKAKSGIARCKGL